MSYPDPTFWRKKLSALMHDSPGKVLQIWDHYQRAIELQLPDKFEDYEHFDHRADHDSSASDRLPWPKPIRSNFDGVENYFRHPMGGNAPFRFDLAFQSVAQAEGSGQTTRPSLINEDDPRGEFFARWRFWRWWASHKDPRLAFMPAETRLPDHTIWSHLFVTSAFQGCTGDDGIKPSLLLFNLGPAQSFISEARSTRDLWSGSYLLSYLTGVAIREIALEIGPDNFLFPNLAGQPLFDLLLKDELWSQLATSKAGNAWECFGYDNASSGEGSDRGARRLLTPSLPNRFLALVPASRAKELGEKAEAALEKAKGGIASTVQDMLLSRVPKAKDHWDEKRFEAQVDRMLSSNWQTFAWPTDIKQAEEISSLLPNEQTSESFKAVVGMAKSTPQGDRDSRYFNSEGNLSNPSSAHSVFYHFTNLLLDGVKNAGGFKAWGDDSSWKKGKDSNKDYLNGREEIMFCPAEHDNLDESLQRQLFKDSEAPGLGASSLIKRLWHYSYLETKYGFSKHDFAMPSTRGIARSLPFSSDEGEGDESNENDYYAVLALDGDEMGKWVSGIKNPKIKEQLSKESIDYFESKGGELKNFLENRRPLSPSFHLQFSEALANFSLYCTARIVESFDGRLIYAGGDDVLAMLPASKAIACAHMLRSAFKGEKDRLNELRGSWESHRGKMVKIEENRLFESLAEGYLRIHEHAEGTEEEPKSNHCILPGPATDVSVGIAIGHERDPLQRIVQAAQLCEKKAKGELGRSALFSQVVKRSGEIVEWGCKWESGGITLLQTLLECMNEGKLTARFPYKLVELLDPYLSVEGSSAESDSSFEQMAEEIVAREMQECMANHWNGSSHEQKDISLLVVSSLSDYWDSMSENSYTAEMKVRSITSFARTLAWLSKRGKDMRND